MTLALLLQIPLATIPGEISDLAPDPIGPGGAGFYTTTQGEVGRFDPSGLVTPILAAGSLPAELRAAYPTPTGDLLILDQFGDLHSLPGTTGPAALVYDDQFLTQLPTDLVVDDAGVAMVSCRTISPGTFAVVHVSPDGEDWAYLHIEDEPVALAPDSTGTSFVMSDGQGFFQSLDKPNGASRTIAIAPTSGFSSAAFDGDIAVENDGDFWFVAGNQLRFFDRSTGLTSTEVTSPDLLRGVVIAPAPGGGHAVFYAGGSGTSTLWRGPASDPPAPVFAQSLGPVPSRGTMRTFSGLNIFDMTVDPSGNLLIGGDNFGAIEEVRRVTIPDFTTTTVAGPADGINNRLEGVAVARDGRILAVDSSGVVFSIEETAGNPIVTTPFVDPTNAIVRAKDLALGRQGQMWIPDITAFRQGAIRRIDPSGQVDTPLLTLESRGVASDPFTGQLISTEWVNSGFNGRLVSLDIPTGQVSVNATMDDLNISNGEVWADGDLLVDARGDIYVSCEDEFSILRYDREHDVRVRVSSGYLNRPSGLALAAASQPQSSATGWSLYVATRNFIFEVDDALPPAPSDLDPFAPPVGALLGWARPEHGEPVDVVADPVSTDLLAITDAGFLLRFEQGSEQPGSVLRGPADGLPPTLTALTATPDGRLAAASAQGTIFVFDTFAGFAVSTDFTDPLNQLFDVSGLEPGPSGELIVIESDPTTDEGGRLWQLQGGTLTPLGDTHHGIDGRIDPLSGQELWVLERGRDGEGGEILRVDLSRSLPVSGHLRTDPFRTFFGDRNAGDLALNAEGDAFVIEGATGRIHRIDRATGSIEMIAGQYDSPRGATIAFSPRGGLDGTGGASLFVADGPVIYEHGIQGGVPGSMPPGTTPIATDLTTPARRVFPGFNRVQINAPGSAGLTYAIFAGLSGKLPGLPLAPDETLPLNFDPLFQLGGSSLFPDFFGVLDGGGNSPPEVGIDLPPSLAIASTGFFLDLTWIALDLGVPSLIGFRGGTTQLYLGL